MSRTKEYLATMVETYAKTLLWTGMDWDDLDENYDLDDVADAAWESMREDCEAFLESVSQMEGDKVFDRIDAEQMGHDFALTRNHHGAGFWDRGLGVLGDQLTALSRPFGESDLYVGDDGKLYVP